VDEIATTPHPALGTTPDGHHTATCPSCRERGEAEATCRLDDPGAGKGCLMAEGTRLRLQARAGCGGGGGAGRPAAGASRRARAGRASERASEQLDRTKRRRPPLAR